MVDEYNLTIREVIWQKICNFLCLIKKEKKPVSFLNKFSSFDEVEKLSEGYEAEQIFNKVRSAVLEVKAGHACFERDGCLFYEKSFYLQLIAILYNIYLREDCILLILEEV